MSEPTDAEIVTRWREGARQMRDRIRPPGQAGAFATNPWATLDPEFASLVNDWALSGYGGEELDLKTRTMCTAAALVASGEEPYATNWMRNALHVGVTPEELVAMLRQLFFYVGTPNTVRGFAALAAALEAPGD